MVERFKPTGKTATTLVFVAIAMTAVVVVGNWGPSTTPWEASVPIPYKVQVFEGPGSEHCQQEDETFLTVSGGKDMGETWGSTHVTFQAPEADATLPAGATFTGWRSGERELWVDWSVPPTQVLGSGNTAPDAVYIVSPSGVERWARYDVYCF